jgi:hypothetical protein
MITFIAAGLAAISFSMYYAYRTRENLVRAASFALIALAFLAALYYHSSKINLILIYRGAFGFENPAGLAFALMIDLLPFRGPPVLLFSKFTALASPEVYTPGGGDLALVVLSKLFLVAGLVLLVLQANVIYLGEVLGRRANALVAAAALLGIVSVAATFILAREVAGPLADPEEARARSIMNAAAFTLLALAALTLTTAYSYFKLYRETGERSYLFQSVGFLLLTLFMGHLAGISSSLTLGIAEDAVASFEAQASVMRIYIAMMVLAALGSILLVLGMILEIAPAAVEEEAEAAEAEAGVAEAAGSGEAEGESTGGG